MSCLRSVAELLRHIERVSGRPTGSNSQYLRCGTELHCGKAGILLQSISRRSLFMSSPVQVLSALSVSLLKHLTHQQHRNFPVHQYKKTQSPATAPQPPNTDPHSIQSPAPVAAQSILPLLPFPNPNQANILLTQPDLSTSLPEPSVSSSTLPPAHSMPIILRHEVRYTDRSSSSVALPSRDYKQDAGLHRSCRIRSTGTMP